MSIELRLSDIDPPAPDPPRTIYRDIVNLPNPVLLGMTVRYFNYDDVGLYFQITGAGAGYTFGTVNLGLLASGTDAYRNLDQLASRAKPSPGDLTNGELDESITLTLKAYTDAGYTTLKWTYNRVVSVKFINSADAAFTVDFLNNFDDGTVQGWEVVAVTSNTAVSRGISTDYVLSTPYSLNLVMYWSGATGATVQHITARLYKSFTTPNKSQVYAIIDIRIWRGADSGSNWTRNKNYTIKKDTDVLAFFGRPYDTSYVEDYFPQSKWMRVVVPLPPNTTLELRVELDAATVRNPNNIISTLRMDDIKIISK